VLGSREAQVGMVEFSDYQCPFCQRFHTQTFPALQKAYIDSGKVQYIFRDFPLAFHPQARGAAVAARCAGKQDAYWDMHHRLFAQPRRLGLELYQELAQTLKLNIATFLSCLQDPEQGKTIENDLTYGQSLGVQGTPSFFIGRVEGGYLVDARQITGAQPFTAFKALIEETLHSTETANR